MLTVSIGARILWLTLACVSFMSSARRNSASARSYSSRSSTTAVKSIMVRSKHFSSRKKKVFHLKVTKENFGGETSDKVFSKVIYLLENFVLNIVPLFVKMPSYFMVMNYLMENFYLDSSSYFFITKSASQWNSNTSLLTMFYSTSVFYCSRSLSAIFIISAALWLLNTNFWSYFFFASITITPCSC